MQMINVGVIGCGYWGPNFVRVFNELKGSKVTWCCDLDEQKLNSIKERYPWTRTTKDYLEILNDPEVVIVVVATPASTHYSVVKDCLSHGKHVLVEKPFTLNTKEGEELIDIARKKNKILCVGHVYEYHPAVQKLKEYISSGYLGNIYYMHFDRTGLGPIRNDVNVIWDLAPHDISIMLYLLDNVIKGKSITVTAKGKSYLREDIEDIAFITLDLPEKIVANIHLSWLDPIKVRKVTVVGDKRMAIFDDTNNLELLKIFDSGVVEQLSSYGEFRLSLRKGDILIPIVEMSEPLKNEAQHFLECVRKGGSPKTSGIDGLRVIQILEAAQLSLKRNGAPIKLEL